MARKSKVPPRSEPEDEPYKVGYGKPPLETRFQPGESGNRKGRPKGARSLATDLKEALKETVEIREGGKTKRVSKQRVFITTTLNNGIKNVGRAPDTVLKLIDRSGIPFEDASDHPVSEDDEALLQMFFERMQRRQALKAAGDGAGEPPDPADKRKKKTNRRAS
jgi:hypothetical protein